MGRKKKHTMPKQVHSGAIGNMSGRPAPDSNIEDRKTEPKVYSGVLSTAQLTGRQPPLIDKKVEIEEKIKAGRKIEKRESITFEGCGSYMVPIPKIEPVIENGQMVQKTIIKKIMVSFGSLTNYQMKTDDPALIEGLRSMGFKEV